MVKGKCAPAPHVSRWTHETGYVPLYITLEDFATWYGVSVATLYKKRREEGFFWTSTKTGSIRTTVEDVIYWMYGSAQLAGLDERKAIVSSAENFYGHVLKRNPARRKFFEQHAAPVLPHILDRLADVTIARRRTFGIQE